MLAADIHVGAVYFEPAGGQDQIPNTFQISFNGGAAGTQLTQVVIDQDKAGDGLTIGDTFFDTAPGGQGSFASHPFQLVDQGGVTSYSVSVVDGGTKMILDFQGFDAGEKFVFSIDVDEEGFNGSSNAVAEGNEFEGSRLTASFVAPHYQDDQVTATFYDFFDQNFAGSGLTNLPNDNYLLPNDPPGAAKDPVFTAGAVDQLTQTALPSDIAGTVYEDVNLNNSLDGADHGIGNVSLTLLALQNGSYVSTGLTTTTDAQGHYKFSNLVPGSYRVVETQPSGYLSVGAQAGNINGVTDGAVLNADTLTDIVLLGGEHSVQNNFGEYQPVSISGFVDVDITGVCTDDPNNQRLPDVTINLFDAQHQFVATTTTDANGQFSFANLKPGEYSLEEVQPAGYLTVGADAGTAGGIVDPSGDKITHIVLVGGQSSTGNEFCETPPASISGNVASFPNGNCEDFSQGTAIAGVTINLFDAGHNLVATTTTDNNGHYSFVNLMPGNYSVEELQPGGYLSIDADPGSAGGIADPGGDKITGIDLLGGQTAIDNDFCEAPPACLEGYVYADTNNNGVFDVGDKALAGVTMQLLDANGKPTGVTTVTDATGFYEFCNLFPGTYGVSETQPSGYLQGTNTPGDAGGTVIADTITGAVLTGGIEAQNYNFGEILPAKISGFVFQDGAAVETPNGQTPNAQSILAGKTGQLDPTDKRLPGVIIQLGDAGGNLLHDANGNVIQTVTDANGYYEFTGLMPGTYSVFEVQPNGYISGINTVGTSGGVAPKPGSTLSPAMLDVLGDRPYDAIVFVPLPAGTQSLSNNFSEVLITSTPPFTPPLTPPPPGTIPFVPFGPPGMPSTIPGGPGTVSMSPPPAMYYGDLGYSGSLPQGYSWHLSVIDGGRPRGDAVQQGYLYSVSEVSSSVFVEASSTLNQGRWMLPGGENGEPRIIPFGRPGSIPIAGDFNGDGAAEVGVFYQGQWFIDLNGNGRWDNDDLWASLGKQGDKPVTGDWDGDGKTDIGIFGKSWEGDPRAAAAEPGLPDPQNAPNGSRKNMPPVPSQATTGWRSLRRTDKTQARSDLIDHVFYFGAPSDIPVTGDWNGDGVDTIGVFNNGVWILDVNGDGHWSPGETMIELGQGGDIPVVGDWDGDGVDDLGVYRDGVFMLDSNHDHVLDAQDKVFELGGSSDKPVVGDWDGDGRDDVGVYRDNGATTWKSL